MPTLSLRVEINEGFDYHVDFILKNRLRAMNDPPQKRGQAMAVEENLTPDLVTVDIVGKPVYLRFQGSHTTAQAEILREECRGAISRVGPGSTAASIFEDFIPATADVQAIISATIQMAREGSCRTTAKVGQGGVVGPMQLGRLQREIEASHPFHDADFLQTAPWKNAGTVLEVQNRDLFAGLQTGATGNDVDALRGVLDERNGCRRDPDETSEILAGLFDLLHRKRSLPTLSHTSAI